MSSFCLFILFMAFLPQNTVVICPPSSVDHVSVRTLHYDPSVLGVPVWHGSYLHWVKVSSFTMTRLWTMSRRSCLTILKTSWLPVLPLSHGQGNDSLLFVSFYVWGPHYHNHWSYRTIYLVYQFKSCSHHFYRNLSQTFDQNLSQTFGKARNNNL